MTERKINRIVCKKKNILPQLIFQLFIAGSFCLFFMGACLFLFIIKDLPRPEKFSEGLIPQSTKIYDREGKIILYEISGEEKRTIVSFDKIPQYLQKAVIAVEDHNFYNHRGIDIKAIARAILYDLKIKKPVQGGSTISQQLIRSYFLTQHKTLKRKTREVILTLELERRYKKEQILEWYFNLIPFGSNIYGIEAISQLFFKKPVSEISLAEASVLAALIKAPSFFWPYGPNLEKLLVRKDFVLDSMVKMNFITPQESEAAKKEKIEFSKDIDIIKAPHFVMYVKKILENKYGTEFLTRAGLKVITTLDIELQEKAENIVKQGVEQIKYANAYNGALVAINPKTGEVLAMVGSKDYFGDSLPKACEAGVNCKFDPQVNVVLSLRQPGSAFKPIIYALAFYKGYSPQTIVVDSFTEFNSNCSPSGTQTKDKYGLRCYHPNNYDGIFKGAITLKSALAESRNVPAVKVLSFAGIKDTLDLAKKLGITTLKTEKDYGLALALGGAEVKLLELASAYGVIANDGVKTPINVIKKIEDPQGKIIEEARTNNIKILPSQITEQLNNILSDNIARAPVFGLRSPLYVADYDVAVKTGTTQQYNDDWTIGYSPSVVVGVWVGNNDNSPTTKPGAILAGPIWNKFIVEALKKIPKENLKKSD